MEMTTIMGSLILSFLSVLILSAPIIALILIKRNQFQKSSYTKETGNTYYKAMKDKGTSGEYFTAKALEKLPGYHKLIVNAYIPNGKGGTTEIDLLFIHETGLYVIESKNYSGWIFGSEINKNWTQTFPNGKKESFYNPIKQNNGHMKALKNLLTYLPENHFKSVIVFSERCELKEINVDSNDVAVLKRENLGRFMSKHFDNAKIVLSKEDIEQIYRTVRPLTQVNNQVKELHNQNVERYKNGQPSLKLEINEATPVNEEIQNVPTKEYLTESRL